MSIKEQAEMLEGMINEDSLMNFDSDMELIDKTISDLVILDVAEIKENSDAPDTVQDRIDDYHYSRQVYINMIKQGNEVLTGALEMVQAAPSPRGFEVVGMLMKNIADNTDKLMKLSKEFKELSVETKSGSGAPEQKADTINNTENNVIFNGSAADLIKMLDGEDVKVIEG